ncbi:Heat shock protein DnaJ, cysteine-rich domain containing protein [Parasponia andersonii]|uniref:Heat shock protein DnaJ, cysteine-rich domain containing protein n=1 Tax=Parasponia andersonii TaxID=3476 RepID=A0A2P5CRG8_PARAD|nr:Heat shock protein DnaJ, cysteine-rich domain containing protein [Parasponia andersonii]
MIMTVRVLSLSPAVRFEATSLNGPPVPHPRNTNPTPRLSFTKPSWVSNVQKEEKNKPDPPCVVCMGSGRTDCHTCHGKGRTNCTHLEMLPKGEWPKWCKTCGGSGLGYCPRCLGTGEYRYIMGFHFMKRDVNHTQDHNSEVLSDQKRRSVADFYEQ